MVLFGSELNNLIIKNIKGTTMKRKLILAALLFASILTTGIYSQYQPAGGTLTCTISGTPFSGSVTSAIYLNADDVLNFNIESVDGGLFQFAISNPKKMIQQQMPFTANYEVQYPHFTANTQETMFYFTYERDKSREGKKYVMLNSQFKLNKFDLADNSIQFDFSATVIMGELQPDATFRETDRLIIENGATDNIKFMNM